ncbi:MAG: hypothetical protein K8T10_12570 [Candidatus Eremiobacteraeota bacterium]|nr:hypothetical protein [Candidatus Eremiobacteraeota bacterium]
MAEQQDRIEEIRSRRSRDGVGAGMAAPEQQSRQIRPRGVSVQRVSERKGPAEGVLGAVTRSPWLRDRVTLSLEAQIAMIEMRANYRLTLADMGYHNRLKIAPIRPGVFLKVEPTGCYRMSYHNRM